MKEITEKPDEHTSFMLAFRAWFQKRVAGPSAVWKGLLNAAKGGATAVGEQQTQGCNSSSEAHLCRGRHMVSVTQAKQSTIHCSTNKVSVAIYGEQKIGYWVSRDLH